MNEIMTMGRANTRICQRNWRLFLRDIRVSQSRIFLENARQFLTFVLSRECAWPGCGAWHIPVSMPPDIESGICEKSKSGAQRCFPTPNW